MLALFERLHAQGKLLTAAVLSRVTADGNIYYDAAAQTNAVLNAVDFINVMAYDGGDGERHSSYQFAVNDNGDNGLFTYISILASREGGDGWSRSNDNSFRISIHASLAGGDRKNRQKIWCFCAKIKHCAENYLPVSRLCGCSSPSRGSTVI